MDATVMDGFSNESQPTPIKKVITFFSAGSSEPAARRLANRRFWISAPLLTLAAAAIFSYTFSLFAEVDQAKVDSLTSSAIEIARDRAQHDFDTVYADLRFLANSQLTHEYLSTSTQPEVRRAIEQSFINLANSHRLYDQLRLISPTGMELIRVNLNGGSPLGVPANQLQDKSQRYYFKATAALPAGKIFVSPLDLNIEGGEIERPYKPMIRFAQPLFGEDNQLLGIVIINYLGDTILRHFKHHMASLPGEGMLVNSEGYWLSSKDPSLEWGFMFGASETFGSRHPQVWDQVKSRDNGVIETDAGRFSFHTVNPFPPSIAQASEPNDSWKIIVLRQQEGFNLAYINSHKAYFYPLLTLYPLALLLLWIWARASAGRDYAEEKLHAMNASLEQLVEARTAELNATKDATIMSLASLAETRDNETGQHIRRTQNYIRVLANALSEHPDFRQQLTPASIELICKSAPLHDIGKVGIPDAILLKPGRLSDDEFEIMKRHTTLGCEALEEAIHSLSNSLSLQATSTFLHYARDIAHYHHERWDGSGYPQGLRGDAIPVAARLMAVADVYDALVSARVYKPAFDRHKTEAIMLEQSSGQFDPRILAAFERHRDAFWVIKQQFADLDPTAPQEALLDSTP